MMRLVICSLIEMLTSFLVVLFFKQDKQWTKVGRSPWVQHAPYLMIAIPPSKQTHK